MNLQSYISEYIESNKDQFIALSDKVWERPEIFFEEHESSAYICEALEEAGFRVEKGVAGLQTGFIGSYGNGKPIVAILGEFDALAGLSQKNGLARKEPAVPGGPGHGCGHNLLGAGALAAAVAIKEYMDTTGLRGTVRFYGCPAEESGSGKAYMVRDGYFGDVDLALSWHPSTTAYVMNASSLANYSARFVFSGTSSHAAIAPHLGRSALDAVELMNIGVNYLREHMISEARIHYAITDSGGVLPNVVPAHAEVVYLIRAPKTQQVVELYDRVYDVAKGAALMTGTKMDVVFEGAALDLIPNRTLAGVMHKHLTGIGVPAYDEADRQYAEAIRNTLTPEELDAAFVGVDQETAAALKDKAISDLILPLAEREIKMLSSTDVGDVSWVVPTMQCRTACWALGTPIHTWQVVAQGAMPIAHKGMLEAGKVIACTAIEAMENPSILTIAKAELSERLLGMAYRSLIPQHLKPPEKLKPSYRAV